MSARLESALKIKDSALVKLRAEGAFENVGYGKNKGSGSFLSWEKDGLRMLYRTPFQKLPPVSDETKYKATVLGSNAGNLRYGLDIWDQEHGGKVLNIEWNGEGDVQLVSFRRGPWEARVLAFAIENE
jgi:hypothetical protein